MAGLPGPPRRVPQSVAGALAPAHGTSLHVPQFPLSPPSVKVLPVGQCLLLLLATSSSSAPSAA